MEFVHFERTINNDNEVGKNNEEGSEDEISYVDSLKSFIDGNMEVEEDRTYYRSLESANK